MRLLFVLALITACDSHRTLKAHPGATSLLIANQTTNDTTVYVSFGADSKITTKDWTFCKGRGLTCNFPLKGSTSITMPNPRGVYTNATFAFGAPVGCGATKAEVNINNPTWYDTLDVSLVDGYSNNLQIRAAPTKGSPILLGPVMAKSGNAKLLGVFPYGCDICVARQNPPCGLAKGTRGCKAGTQYNPKPPCQWQGSVKGGGQLAVTIGLVE